MYGYITPNSYCDVLIQLLLTPSARICAELHSICARFLGKFDMIYVMLQQQKMEGYLGRQLSTGSSGKICWSSHGSGCWRGCVCLKLALLGA